MIYNKYDTPSNNVKYNEMKKEYKYNSIDEFNCNTDILFNLKPMTPYKFLELTKLVLNQLNKYDVTLNQVLFNFKISRTNWYSWVKRYHDFEIDYISEQDSVNYHTESIRDNIDLIRDSFVNYCLNIKDTRKAIFLLSTSKEYVTSKEQQRLENEKLALENQNLILQIQLQNNSILFKSGNENKVKEKIKS